MILFNDKYHTYYDTEQNKYLKSVTTRLKDFQIEFDEDTWSDIKAKDYGITQEQVIQYWEYLRQIGTIKGSIVHNYLEKRWFGKIVDYEAMIPRTIFSLPDYEFLSFLNRLRICIGYAENFVNDAFTRFEPIEAEKIVSNKNYAGQIDLLVKDKKLGKNRIVDYKTDKEIQYYNKFANLTGEFSHLSNCNFTKYSLQTNCYNELEGLDEAPIIVHINEKNDNYKLMKADLYPKEAKLLMS
jgi:hypothetical protein